MSEQQLDKEPLIFQFQAGCPKAMREIFMQFFSTLRYFATNLINNSDEAEDIVSNSFMKVYDRRESFCTINEVKAFLFVATRNNCLDYLRTQQRHEHSHRELMYLQDKKEEMADTEMFRAKILQEIYNEIENLPPKCRAIFKLIYIKGLNTKQIAEELGLSQQTVLNQKAKAVQSLRMRMLSRNLMPTPALIALCSMIALN